MKTFFLFIIIHYSLLVVSCYPQVSTWSRVLGGPNFDRAATVFQTRDNGFLAIGFRQVRSLNNNEYIPQTCLVKFDYWGTILWQKLYGDSLYPNLASSGVEDEYGNFYIPYIQNVCRLMKTDSHGNILWTKSYPTNIQEFGGT